MQKLHTSIIILFVVIIPALTIMQCGGCMKDMNTFTTTIEHAQGFTPPADGIISEKTAEGFVRATVLLEQQPRLTDATERNSHEVAVSLNTLDEIIRKAGLSGGPAEYYWILDNLAKEQNNEVYLYTRRQLRAAGLVPEAIIPSRE